MDRFSDEAAGWDEKPGHADRARSVAAVVRSAVPLRPGMSVLEIGGGTGLLARALAEDIGTAVVTDVAPGMVEVATSVLDDPRYAGWSARLFDVEHDELPAERYDLVLALLALHHMGDVGAVIDRCGRLLAPAGHLALIDLDHDADGAFHAHVHDFDGHNGFRREDVAGWFDSAGLVDVATADAGVVDKEGADGAPAQFPMFIATGRRPE